MSLMSCKMIKPGEPIEMQNQIHELESEMRNQIHELVFGIGADSTSEDMFKFATLGRAFFTA